MATKASYQIETLGSTNAPSASKSPSSGRKKSRWPAVKKVLGKTPNHDTLPKSATSKPPNSGGHRKPRWPAARKVLWGELNRSPGYLSSTRLNVIKVPDYCEEHVPLHTSFTDEANLGMLLREMEKKDLKLQEELEILKSAASATSASNPNSSFDFGSSIDPDELRDKFGESVEVTQAKRMPDHLRQYQDFVSLFVSVLLQSKFAKDSSGISCENDPGDVIRTMGSTRTCPDVHLFRRVAVDPSLLAAASPDEDNLGFAENGVAVNQLARLLDVAVLQFLSTVNEHTDIRAVVWALDYMKNLLSSLITSMNSLNSFGWYGAPHIRIRKGTAMGRRSITYPMQAPNIIPPPPVVVVGTPPSSPRHRSPDHIMPPSPSPSPPSTARASKGEFRDPVTGQPSPIAASPVHSPLAQRQTAFPRLGPELGSEVSFSRSRTNSGSSKVGSSQDVAVVVEAASAGDVGVANAGGGGDRRRRTSRQEHQNDIISQHHPPEISFSPPQSPIKSLSPPSSSPSLSPSPLHSPTHKGTPPVKPSERKRKVTPAPMMHGRHGLGGVSPQSGPGAVMGRIQEDLKEEEEEEEEEERGLGSVGAVRSYASSMVSIREEDEEEEEEEEEEGEEGEGLEERMKGKEEMFAMDSVEKDYFNSIKEEVGPPIVKSPPLSPLAKFQSKHTSQACVQRLRGHSPPVMTLEGPLSPTEQPSSPMRSPDFSPSPSPIHYKGRGMKASSMTPPPAPKDIPEVDMNLEMMSLLNGEGRISLIAILHAIAKFPRNENIWTAEVGEKCFSLIQLCMDIGMPPQKEEDTLSKPSQQSSSQERRRRFFKQENTAFNRLGRDASSNAAEKPWKVHSKLTIKFAINALIQCGICCIIGCSSTDTALSHFRYSHLAPEPAKASSVHSRLIHNMRRIHLHSPATFREALIEFADPAQSSCRRVFQFLHVVLQYSVHGNGEMHFTNLLASVVVSVLRITVDRVMELDITETSIQETVIREACDFIHYSNQLFYHDTVAKSKAFQHLHMYIHRIALSVILPPRPLVQAEEPVSPIQDLVKGVAPYRPGGGRRMATVDIQDSDGDSLELTGSGYSESPATTTTTTTTTLKPRVGSLPGGSSMNIEAGMKGRRGVGHHHAQLTKHKSLGSAVTASPVLQRARSSSFNSPSSSSSEPPVGSEGEQRTPKSATKTRTGKSPLLKQQTLENIGPLKSLFSKTDSVRSSINEKTGGGGAADEGGANETEWRGLRLDSLRHRIQRLVVLMNLSEPGTIPNPSILASLLDLCDGTTVVARSMVFLECALFVRRLSNHTPNSPCTIWICHNLDSPRMYSIAANLRKWAEAIGEKLRLSELRDKEMHLRLQNSKSGKEFLPEEPVFPDVEVEDHDPNIGLSISYALKMAACNLLLEITKFLRDIPPLFAPAPPVSQVGTPVVPHHFNLDPANSLNFARKVSDASAASSEAEGGGTTYPTRGHSYSSDFKAPSPSIGHFKSSLSVEDAEPPHFIEHHALPSLPSDLTQQGGASGGGGEEHTLPLNTSPRKKRTSFYLQINTASKTPSGSLNRNTSVRKQSRMVRVTETPTSVESRTLTRPAPIDVRAMTPRAPSVGLSTSPSQRKRRKSISTTLRRNSIYHANTSFLASSQPSHAILVPSGTRGRRKSVGALYSSNRLDDYIPTTPVTPHPPAGQSFGSSSRSGTGGGGGGASGFGNSLNIGFSKLKRSAQKAFRRHGSKHKGSVSEISPNSSPGPIHRSKSHVSDTYSQKSVFYPSLSEESWRYYPWLDMLEHMVLINTRQSCKRHKRSCQELICALKKVYCRNLPAKKCEEESSSGVRGSRGGNKGKKDSTAFPVHSYSPDERKLSSLGSIFIHRLTITEMDPFADEISVSGGGGGTPHYNRIHSLPVNRAKRMSIQPPLRSASADTFSSPHVLNRPNSTSSSTSPFARLTFSRVSSAGVINSLLANKHSEETIQLTIEAESPYEKGFLTAQADKERRRFIDFDFAGLMHSPFSTLVHAAPILHSRTFSTLKGVAWDALIGPDQELSQAAAAFFLLASAKESEKTMKGFVASKVLSRSPEEQCSAILKFKVLWDCRYGVWPRMEERAQKKLNLNDKEDRKENEQTIGYSLLANLLGHPGDDLPLSPCDPVSVCSNTKKVCGNSPGKCYRPTKLAPIIHTDEISEKVHGYSVSGVSLIQEAGIKSSSVVYHGFESDDAAAPREWEAVDPTLFPRTLLPLIKFLLQSLVPSSSPSPPSPSGPSQATPTTKSTPTSAGEKSEDLQLQLDKSELARQVVWACMVEDPRLFFRPLFNRFNKLYMLIGDKNNKKSNMEYLMASCLKPFHIVLQAFPKLPSQAAHVLFNNFVGVVLQHTDQPYSFSGKIVQSVLTLIAMVTPSVQGLDTKLLKSILKKESCYTTMMSTARIRGVDKVIVLADNHYGPRLYKVTEEMTFGHLIGEACATEHLSLELLNKWYLEDKNKGVPLLSSLVVQDHYSVSADQHHPTFILHQAESSSENVWGHQMDQLFVFKMSEIMRILFTMRLLKTGPEVEKGFTYSEYAMPNYQFIHNELVELNSFPRKALTSIMYEAGPNVQHVQLRSSDVMLKGMWVRFVLELISSASAEFDWSSSMLLFINVVNGALLLHSDDQTILYYSLVTILTAVTKFNSIFKKDGYQMIIPALVQVYSLHLKNSLVTKAIKFVWRKFYLLNENVFFLQVTAAASTLLSDEAAVLSSCVSSKLTLDSRRSLHMELEDVRRLNAKALFELNSTLVEGGRGVQDELNILHCCQQYLDGPLYQTLTTDLPRPGLSVKDAAVLCVTLARWNPEVLRGMQVLVFLDHMMPLILPSLGMAGQKFTMETLQYLVRGCESIAKVQRTHKREHVRRKAGVKGDKKLQALGQSFADDDTVDPRFFTAGNTGTGNGSEVDGRGTAGRKSSVAKAVNKIKIIYNPKTKNLAAAAHQQEGGGGGVALVEEDTPPTSHKLVHQTSVVGGGAGGASTGGQNQFRLTRTNHRVVRLSTNSLLSIVSEFFLYYSRKGVFGSVAAARKHSTTRKPSVTYLAEGVVEEVSRVSFDPPSVSVLVTIATNMLLSYNEQILQGKGLNNFFLHLLPNLDWSDQAHLPSFSALLGKIFRLFKHLQKNTNKAILLYDNLTNFIVGITQCIHNSPQLVQGQDQHLLKLKSILDVVMVMQSGRSDPQMSAFHKRYSRVLHRPLLENAPSGFAEAVIGLAAELITVTNGVAQNKYSYHMSDLVTHKSLKEYEEFLMPKIILPLCIQLGLRADTSKVPVAREDVDFMIQFVEGNKLELFFKFPHQKLLIEQIFRVVRVICCAFSESLTLYQWHKLAHWIFSLLNKKLSLPSTAKKTSSASINNVSKVDLSRTGRDRNRLSSISGSSVSPLESFISFHENLLLFFESFLLVYRVPLFSLLFPILWKLEPVLQEAKEKVKVENPAQLEKVTNCIDRCQKLQRLGSQPPTMKSREQLLKEILDDLRWIQYQGRATLNRSHTTVESKKKLEKKRRSSVTLTKIKEESGSVEGFATVSASLPRSAAINVKRGGRRNVLGLQIPRSASASAGTSHRPPSSPTGGPLSPPASAGITGGKEKQRFVAASLPRRGVASKPGLSTIEASPSRRPKRHSPIPPGRSSPRRSPLRKSPRENSPSPETTTRGEGTKVRTKSKKHLKQLGGSVEYPADDEGVTDQDALDVIVNSQTNSPAQPRQQGHDKDVGSRARRTKGSPSLFKKKMVSFDESLSIDSHSVNSSRAPPQVVVAVEVHGNSDVAPILEDHIDQRHTHLSQDEVKPKQRSPSNSPSLSKHDLFSEGLPVGSYRQISPSRMLDASITSETKLLPDSGSEGGGSKGNSPSAKRKMRRSKSPSLSSMKKMLSLSQSPTIQGDDEGERLLEKNSGGGGSPYFAWGRTHPAGVKGEDNNAAVGKRAFSWERRTSNSSSKGLPQFSDSDSDDTAL